MAMSADPRGKAGGHLRRPSLNAHSGEKGGPSPPPQEASVGRHEAAQLPSAAACGMTLAAAHPTALSSSSRQSSIAGLITVTRGACAGAPTA